VSTPPRACGARAAELGEQDDVGLLAVDHLDRLADVAGVP
jgi:hypothetical protein